MEGHQQWLGRREAGDASSFSAYSAEYSARITEETPVVAVNVPSAPIARQPPPQSQTPKPSPKQSIPWRSPAPVTSPSSVPYMLLADRMASGAEKTKKKKTKKAPRAPKHESVRAPSVAASAPFLRTGLRAASGDIMKNLQVLVKSSGTPASTLLLLQD